MTEICGHRIHPAAELFPLMSNPDLRQLAEDIQTNGLREPITTWGPDGPVIDGRNRLLACEHVDTKPDFIALDPDHAGDPIHYVVSLNLHRRHLTESQRAMVAAKIATTNRGDNQHSSIELTSQSKAAELLNVSLPSVKRAKQVNDHGTPELADLVNKGDIPVSVAATVAQLPEDQQTEVTSQGPEAVRLAATTAKKTKPHVTNNSGNNEWYTPKEIIEAARTTMGGIDLDPASSDEANEIVGATKYYTTKVDGLARPWHGRIFLNPPYGTDLITKFAEKLVHEYDEGNIEEAVVITNNATETEWFATLAAPATALFFPRHRIRFWAPGQPSKTPLQGQAIFYIGPNNNRFFNAFKDALNGGTCCLIL